MFGLGSLLSSIGEAILWGIESLVNLVFEGVQLIFNVVSVIGLPEEPAVPEFIENLNWFFPVGAIVTIMSPILFGYGAFLLVRWLYQKTGNL